MWGTFHNTVLSAYVLHYVNSLQSRAEASPPHGAYNAWLTFSEKAIFFSMSAAPKLTCTCLTLHLNNQANGLGSPMGVDHGVVGEGF